MVERAETFGLQHLADDPAVLDGQLQPATVEVGTHGGLL
jgi:hypothetical protein